MDTPRQCPNCGGFKIDMGVSKLALGNSFQTNDLKPFFRTVGIIFHLLIWPTILAFSFAVVNIVDSDPNSRASFPPALLQYSGPAFLIGLFALVVLFIYTANSYQVKNYNRLKNDAIANATRTYYYRCQICRFTWQWKSNEPYPYPPGSFTPNLQLYDAGMKRLAEEEAEKERKRKIAAAAYMMEQQRRNRENR